MLMKEWGLRVFSGGFVLHSDGRRRRWSEQGVEEIPKHEYVQRGPRGEVKAFSEASARRLELIAASAANQFRSMVTLTYHGLAASWEDDADRNLRIVRRSKVDLNRFFSALRGELGAYIWVQEFQARGVVHYHVACEQEIAESRVALAWCRATDALDDAAALRHAVKVEQLRSEGGARWYLGRYVGKARQKCLPVGVQGAGRWWGRSRGVTLAVLADVVVMVEGDTVACWVEARVLRSLRRFLCGALHFRFRGGTIVDWNGKLSRRAAMLVEPLAAYYRSQVPDRSLLEATS